MIQVQTLVKISDNSGAKIGQCIKILKGSRSKTANVGDFIILSVKKLKMIKKIKKKDIVLSLVIRTKKEHLNKDGSFSKFKTNAVTLLNKKKRLIANKIVGPISKNLRKKQFKRIYGKLKTSLI